MANVITDETIEYVGILAKLELSDEEKEAAKQKAEEILDEWMSGDATEDSFAALAKKGKFTRIPVKQVQAPSIRSN